MTDRKIKILQINKLYYPYIGGVEQVVQQIAEGLNDTTDMRVLVCQDGKKTIRERLNQVEVIRTGSIAKLGNMPLSLRFVRELRKQAKDRDVLFFHMPNPMGDLAYFLSGVRRKRVIVWWHSDVVRQKKLMILYRPLMEWFLKQSEQIIVATEGHIEGSAYLKPHREKCIVIPYGLRKEIEEDAKLYYEQEKTKLNGSDDTVKFLFVGRLVYYKGCDVLLQAFYELKDERVELVLAGDGPMQKELEAYIQEHGLKRKVILKHHLSDEELMKEYRNCDVFILPSIARSEAFGLVQIEAMSYGKSIINTNLPSGVPYVSRNGETGLTVEAGNVEQLKDAMEWMLRHKEERLQMGNLGRKKVKEIFSQRNMCQKVEKLLLKQ